jgi:hypothetical protein
MTFTDYFWLALLIGGALFMVYVAFEPKLRKPKQYTWCWCPRCKQDLCSNGSFLSDDERGVRYHCNVCHHDSTWYFDDIAPFVIDGKYQCPTPVIHGDMNDG